MQQTKNSIKKVKFWGKRDFYASLKIWSFWKLTPDFQNRYKHRFKRQLMQWKVKAYTAISSKTYLGRFSMQNGYPSCILLLFFLFFFFVCFVFFFCLFFFFLHKFKISIKWFLWGEFRLSLCKLKHQNMKKVFHTIFWNQANLPGDAAGKTFAFVYAKPPYLVMKSSAPFSKRQSWFWLSFTPMILV